MLDFLGHLLYEFVIQLGMPECQRITILRRSFYF